MAVTGRRGVVTVAHDRTTPNDVRATTPCDDAPTPNEDSRTPLRLAPAPRRRFPLGKVALLLSDALALMVAVMVALALGGEGGFDGSGSSGVGTWFGVAFAATLVALVQQRCYRARFVALRRSEYSRILRAVALGVVASIVIGFLFDATVPTSVLWLLLTGPAALFTSREVARRVFDNLRGGGRMTRRAVVVGANSEAEELSVMLMGTPILGYEVVGRVDTTQESGDPLPRRTVLAAVSRLTADTGSVNVIIATSAMTLDIAGYLTRRLTEQGLHVEMCMPLPDIDVSRLQLRPLGRFPVFYVERVDHAGWGGRAKRMFDVMMSAFGLVLVLPVLAIAAVLIRLTSPGPVIFRQQRVGRDGVPFNVLKLRTMVVDAESKLDELKALNEADGPVFKMRRDPRVTPVGRVLRKFSIDELPQLWNVVRGEMSLVGPRPALAHEMESWSADLHERLRVRPGITGMWQVSGRADSSGSDYVRLDLYYVDNWSLLMDLVIIGKTVPAVIFGRGAY